MLDGKANSCSQWFLSLRSVASGLEKALLAWYDAPGFQHEPNIYATRFSKAGFTSDGVGVGVVIRSVELMIYNGGQKNFALCENVLPSNFYIGLCS